MEALTGYAAKDGKFTIVSMILFPNDYAQLLLELYL